MQCTARVTLFFIRFDRQQTEQLCPRLVASKPRAGIRCPMDVRQLVQAHPRVNGDRIVVDVTERLFR